MKESPHRSVAEVADHLGSRAPECPGHTFNAAKERVHELGFKSPCHSKHQRD
jgi:hypothetical protein